MIYNVINLVAIVLGGIIGGLVGDRIPKKQLDSVLVIAAMCLLVVGFQGAVASENLVLMLISLSIAGIIGTTIDIDGKFNSFGQTLKRVVKIGDEKFSEGLVTVIMIHIIGSMAILGPVNAAIKNDGSILLLKSVLDFVFTLIFSTSFGAGMMLSGPVTFLYQSIFFLLAYIISPILTPAVANEISAIGSVLIIGLGFNLLKIKEIKISDYLPAILGPIIYQIFLNLL